MSGKRAKAIRKAMKAPTGQNLLAVHGNWDETARLRLARYAYRMAKARWQAMPAAQRALIPPPEPDNT